MIISSIKMENEMKKYLLLLIISLFIFSCEKNVTGKNGIIQNSNNQIQVGSEAEAIELLDINTIDIESKENGLARPLDGCEVQLDLIWQNGYPMLLWDITLGLPCGDGSSINEVYRRTKGLYCHYSWTSWVKIAQGGWSTFYTPGYAELTYTDYDVQYSWSCPPYTCILAGHQAQYKVIYNHGPTSNIKQVGICLYL